MSIIKHHGSCLCRDVQFEVELDLSKGSRCNCTMCTKLGAVGSLVKPAAFTLLSPESSLHSFTRHPEIGQRHWCARCHIFCLGKGHLEMLGGDSVSVNLNCIDGFDVSKTEFAHWDGRHDNWSAICKLGRWNLPTTLGLPLGLPTSQVGFA